MDVSVALLCPASGSGQSDRLGDKYEVEATQ